jgi:hypothetical protein
VGFFAAEYPVPIPVIPGECYDHPFVGLSVRKFALTSRLTDRSGRTRLTHVHYVALDATGEDD